MPARTSVDAKVPLQERESGSPSIAAPSKRQYTATLIVGSAAVLHELKTLETAATALAFQRLFWLEPLYQCLAADLGARACAISVVDTSTGELAALLPLVVTHNHGLKVAAFASLGVSDYGAPVLGPAAPIDAADAQSLWAAVKLALKSSCDLVELSNMPRVVEGRPNPLALVASRLTARHTRHALTLDGTVEDFLVSRGKKYRKEAERCMRLLKDQGAVEFRRAETDHDMAKAFAALEHQQRDRHLARGSDYRLDQPTYTRFFKEALRAGTSAGAVHIFTLASQRSNGHREIVAVLYGLSSGTTFTLLRISTAGEAWSRMSPGRLIVLEAMRYFLALGVSTFDMGIGDYAFKHGFGVEREALSDLVAALSVRGQPRALGFKIKAEIRRHPRLVDAAKRLLGRH